MHLKIYYFKTKIFFLHGFVIFFVKSAINFSVQCFSLRHPLQNTMQSLLCPFPSTFKLVGSLNVCFHLSSPVKSFRLQLPNKLLTFMNHIICLHQTQRYQEWMIPFSHEKNLFFLIYLQNSCPSAKLWSWRFFDDTILRWFIDAWKWYSQPLLAFRDAWPLVFFFINCLLFSPAIKGTRRRKAMSSDSLNWFFASCFSQLITLLVFVFHPFPLALFWKTVFDYKFVSLLFCPSQCSSVSFQAHLYGFSRLWRSKHLPQLFSLCFLR